MDCPSEENLIRMKLEGHSNIEHLEFDIPNRQLTVFHHDNIEGIGEFPKNCVTAYNPLTGE